MPTIYVNNTALDIGADEKINCIQAAQRVGTEIPHYCWHPALSVVASCRMCLVEIGQKKPDGTIAMQPKLIPGCQTPVTDGMVIVSDSEKVKAAQKATLEYLLLDHPLDCPTCDQAGECLLQDYSYKYGRGYSRLQEPKEQPPDKPYIGDQITLFTDRCIMCSRCVRFTREISGTAELTVIDRGNHSEIDIFPGNLATTSWREMWSTCARSARCAAKTFLYKQRVWWLKTANSVCPNCSTGCSVYVDESEDQVYRLRPRGNPLAQGDFMCDEGRFGWKYMHSEPAAAHAGTALQAAESYRAIGTSCCRRCGRRSLRQRRRGEIGARVVAVDDAGRSVSAGQLFESRFRRRSRWRWGRCESSARTTSIRKMFTASLIEPTKFTIRAEKCPNRRGVEMILQHFEGGVVPIGRCARSRCRRRFRGMYLVGGDPQGWINESQAAALDKVGTVIVQDILPSAASSRAGFRARRWIVRRAGRHVCESCRARARDSPGDPLARRGTTGWSHLVGTGRTAGAVNLSVLRREMAEQIPALAKWAEGAMGDFGLPLGT